MNNIVLEGKNVLTLERLQDYEETLKKDIISLRKLYEKSKEN